MQKVYIMFLILFKSAAADSLMCAELCSVEPYSDGS